MACRWDDLCPTTHHQSNLEANFFETNHRPSNLETDSGPELIPTNHSASNTTNAKSQAKAYRRAYLDPNILAHLFTNSDYDPTILNSNQVTSSQANDKANNAKTYQRAIS
jgi:hypothetical protein